jgi:hypothetical protein
MFFYAFLFLFLAAAFNGASAPLTMGSLLAFGYCFAVQIRG